MNTTLWPAMPATNSETANTSDDALRQWENNRGEPTKPPTRVSLSTGTREQLAAAIVDAQDSLPGASLVIHGTPGDWSVAVTGRYDQPEALWLASSRRPTVMRCFKDLNAAHNAALEILKLADPLAAYHSIRVNTRTSHCAALPA